MIATVGNDGGDAGAHRTPTDDQFAFALDQADVTYLQIGNVGNGIERTGGEDADADADVSGSGPRVGRHDLFPLTGACWKIQKEDPGFHSIQGPHAFRESAYLSVGKFGFNLSPAVLTADHSRRTHGDLQPLYSAERTLGKAVIQHQTGFADGV